MISKGVKLSSLRKRGDKYIYRNRFWTLDKPVPSTSKGKKMMVLASKLINGEKRVKVIHFGALGYGHNYSKKAKENYLKRSAGIRNKKGELTMYDKWSPNYWSRKILWPKGKPATGPRTTKKAA
ncbi:MAG: hypothetical protein H7A41_03425 [Chlamydiales bacterium]|nr:hypothetical protein [Chlamydiia bacterium]MCP5504186.1 hypothetical protein [Chlamydiales bacterium]